MWSKNAKEPLPQFQKIIGLACKKIMEEET